MATLVSNLSLSSFFDSPFVTGLCMGSLLIRLPDTWDIKCGMLSGTELELSPYECTYLLSKITKALNHTLMSVSAFVLYMMV